jgi:DNA-binding winged helix-turn-helix (wHTH) protein/TolB-like protein
MEKRLNFDEFSLDLKNEELMRGGKPVPLQPQPMKVLLLLARRAGEIVTREELRAAVWGAETHVDFDQGLNWCVRRIREALGDDVRRPRFVQTIPRRGYRFLIVPTATRSRRWQAAAAVVLLACLATAGVQRGRGVTVVVLPFDNFSGDPRNDVVAQATTEEIINRVGGIDPERVRVIDRLTAAKFKRTNECIIHIGQALGAQYVMEGSVQKTHATAALYRVADNTQVWATAAAPAMIAARVESTFRR